MAEKKGINSEIALKNCLAIMKNMENQTVQEIFHIFASEELKYLQKLLQNKSIDTIIGNKLINGYEDINFRGELLNIYKKEINIGTATEGLCKGKAIMNYKIQDKIDHQKIENEYKINVYVLTYKLLSLSAFQAYRLVIGLYEVTPEHMKLSFIGMISKHKEIKNEFNISEEEPGTIPGYEDMLIRAVERIDWER